MTAVNLRIVVMKKVNLTTVKEARSESDKSDYDNSDYDNSE